MNDHDKQALKALYRQTRTEQPSAQLDKRIREAAHKAITVNKPNWIWSLSTAAVVVLSVSVVLDVYQPETAETEIQIKDPYPLASQHASDMANEKPALSPSPIAPQPVVKMAPLKSKESVSTMAPKSIMPETAMQEMVGRQEQEKRMRSSLLLSEMQRQSVASEPMEKKKQSVISQLNDTSDQVSRFSSIESSSLGAVPEQALSIDQISTAEESASIPQLYSIPQFPISVEGILGLNDKLTAVKEDSGVVSFNKQDDLVLTMQKQADVTIFEAYRGIEELSVDGQRVEIDWTMKPDLISACQITDIYRICALSDAIEAHFIGEKLMKLHWFQPVK